MTEPSPEPRTLVEHAADSAFEAMRATLEAGGAEAVQALVLVVASGVPEGEPDSTTAGSGIVDAADLVSLVASHLVAVGRSVGVDILLVPMEG